MPAGQLAYTGITLTPVLTTTLRSWLFGVSSDPSTEEGKSLEKAMKSWKEAGLRRRLETTNVPMSGVQVRQYENPAKAVAAQLEVFRTLKKGSVFQQFTLKDNPVVKEKAQKYGAFEFHSVRCRWDLDKTLEGLGAPGVGPNKAMTEMMKTVLGDGMNLWFGTDGKVVLQVNAKDWPTARAQIVSYHDREGTLDETGPFKAVAGNLPAHASLFTLIDVPLYMEVTVKTMLAAASNAGASIPPGFDKPAVKPATTYLGLAGTIESGRANVDVWLSATTIHDVYKMYVEKLIQQFLPGGPPGEIF